MTAEKVGGFPRPPRPGRNVKYPWLQVADDGGVWRLDPAEYDVKDAAVLTSAAHKWARANGRKAVTMIDDGCLFVQFAKLRGRTS